jgi:hypothetical protein
LARPLARLGRYGFLIIIGVMIFLPMIGRGLGIDLAVFHWIVIVPVQWLFTLFAALAGLDVPPQSYPSPGSSVRHVSLGWVEDWDDDGGIFLIGLGERPRKRSALRPAELGGRPRCLAVNQSVRPSGIKTQRPMGMRSIEQQSVRERRADP